MNRILLFALLLFVISVSSCRKDKDEDTLPPLSNEVKNFSYEVAHEWNLLFLKVERYTPGYRPPVSARAAAYIGLSAYEAVVNGMSDEYNSFNGHYLGLNVPKTENGQEYNWALCANAAYAKAFSLFFPTAPAAQQFEIISLEQRLQQVNQVQVSQDVINRSIEYGRAVAQAVYDWSATDANGHEAYLRNTSPDYVPPVGLGKWQPTFPDYLPGLLPYWGNTRTFAANSDDSVLPPLPYSEDPNSQIYVQAKETQVLINNIKGGKNFEDKWIAEFWSDDCPVLTFTPAGRWIAVTNQLVHEENLTLDEAIYAYAKVGMAICDAGIRCWGEKYKYNTERPIDYIRRVFGDSDWNTIMCPDGSGRYYTPNFPGYPSGHATFGAAAAEVLTDLFGYHHPMTDKCHLGRVEFSSTPRSFQNFYAMAQENAYSRIPIGVHFRMDSEAGNSLGYKIGRKINALPWKK